MRVSIFLSPCNWHRICLSLTKQCYYGVARFDKHANLGVGGKCRWLRPDRFYQKQLTEVKNIYDVLPTNESIPMQTQYCLNVERCTFVPKSIENIDLSATYLVIGTGYA